MQRSQLRCRFVVICKRPAAEHERTISQYYAIEQAFIYSTRPASTADRWPINHRYDSATEELHIYAGQTSHVVDSHVGSYPFQLMQALPSVICLIDRARLLALQASSMETQGSPESGNPVGLQRIGCFSSEHRSLNFNCQPK